MCRVMGVKRDNIYAFFFYSGDGLDEGFICPENV